MVLGWTISRLWTRTIMTNNEQTTPITPALRAEFEQLILQVKCLASDVKHEVARIMQDAADNPLSNQEATALLERVLQQLKSAAQARGDQETIEALAGNVRKLAERILESSRG